MLGYSIRLAMVKTNEKACICKVNVLPQDSGRPEEDVGVIIGSQKKGINIGGLVRHKAEHKSGLPAAHYRYTRGKTRGYGNSRVQVTHDHRSMRIWVHVLMLRVPAAGTCGINFLLSTGFFLLK